jgi:hypothetical protein
MPFKSDYLLALLNSRILWFILTRLGQSLGERAGSQRYRLFTQFMSRMPIPSIPEVERDTIGSLAMRITEETHTRYDLHRKTQRRIHTDLGTLGKKLNQKLTAWWNLDFATFRAEVKKVFKLDIPLSERDEWEDWLKERRGQHERLTGEIVRLETELNERVYELFDLTSEEIQVVEESTKYRYGEV